MTTPHKDTTPPQCTANLCNWQPLPTLSSFFHCQDCRLIFNSEACDIKYEDEYFLEEYKKQYGKNYFEDKESIQRRMAQRLNHLTKYLKKDGFFQSNSSKIYKLLEIGSACGFFLELAQKAGFETLGWEISSLMAKRANQNGLKTLIGDFENLFQKWIKSPSPVEIIASFYVIEHFRNPFLFWEVARQMLSKGGFLVVSVPSISGPTFFFNKEKWLEQHPTDHFVDYSLKSLKKISKAYSFTLVTIYSEGIHPDRFPWGKLPVFRSFYRLFQNKVPFSDTVLAIFKRS